MFIAVLFTIVRAWKEPKCLPTEQWIRKMWYIIQPLKIIIIMLLAATWMDLEIGILSEVSQTQKDKFHMILLICGV